MFPLIAISESMVLTHDGTGTRGSFSPYTESHFACIVVSSVRKSREADRNLGQRNTRPESANTAS